MSDEEFYLLDLKSKFNKIKAIGLDKYYLSYSGGKDSHFLYWFIKEYATEFSEIEVVGINTQMEYYEIRDRIIKNSDRVLLPAKKHKDIKRENGIPCFSKSQDELIRLYQKYGENVSAKTLQKIKRTEPNMFNLNKTASELVLSGKLHKVSADCCKYLKKIPAKNYEKETGKKAILGVRSSESLNRRAKYKSCFTKDKKFTPLHDLSDELLDKIYKKYNIELPKIYEHVTRTGCVGCPYGKNNEIEEELKRTIPNQRRFICDYFKESYEVLGINTDIEEV